MNTITRKSLAVATVVLLSSLCTAPAAFADQETRSQTVKFYDLNVNSPEGVKALYARIRKAAERVCSETDPVMAPRAVACIRASEAKAVETLSLPQLTAFYQEKSGNKQPARLIAQR